jgi:hypothetical protein
MNGLGLSARAIRDLIDIFYKAFSFNLRLLTSFSFGINFFFDAAEEAPDGGEFFGEVLANGAVFAVHFGAEGADFILGTLDAGAVFEMALEAHFVGDEAFFRGERAGNFTFLRAGDIPAIEEVLETSKDRRRRERSYRDDDEDKDGHLLEPGGGYGFDGSLGEHRMKKEEWRRKKHG